VDSFQAKLASAAQRVEARLARLFQEQSGGTPVRLLGAMQHAALGGGKRFRPFLVLESAELFAADPRNALDVAAALELVHCYSLVHDDLPAMDNDELRRGRPTVWKAYDEWTAILAGDALLTLAFEVICGDGSGIDVPTQSRLVRRLAMAAGGRGMVGGQTLDLEADKRGEPSAPTLAHIERLQSLKTGALIGFACEAGALLGGAAAADLAAMQTYGAALGQAFQLSDDLLDVSGTAAIVGKAVAKDAAVGKATLVGLLGEPVARQRLSALVDGACRALQPYGTRAASLIEAARFMATREA
jgi:farnesyl diphosphate synthase